MSQPKKALREMVSYFEQVIQSHLGFSLMSGNLVPQGLNYVCFEDLVLDRGRGVASSALTPEEHQAVLEIAEECGPFYVKHCYANAYGFWETARELGYEGVSYWEGYAQGLAMIPVLHAWCTFNGKVIDLTWRTHDVDLDGLFDEGAPDFSDRVLGKQPREFAYYGIEFKDMTESPPLIDDMENGFPLLRQERNYPHDPGMLERAKTIAELMEHGLKAEEKDLD